MSDPDAEVIIRRLRGMLHQDYIVDGSMETTDAMAHNSRINRMDIKMLNGKCVDLFSEYSLSIGE